MYKSWEGYGKNWIHVVYKLDHLLRSIRVSDKNSYVTKAFHFFWTYFNSRIFVHLICPITSHISKFQHFLTSFAIFYAFNVFFALNALKLKSTTNELWKGWNLAWYHHFTHIECVQKLRGLRQKLDALRVQTGPSPSKYQGFRRKLICYKGISFF